MTKEKETILTALKESIKGRELGNFDDAFLAIEIDLAIGEINRCRRFTPTDKKLYDKKLNHSCDYT